MKKILAFILTLSLLLPLTACETKPKESLFYEEGSFAEVKMLESSSNAQESAYTVAAELEPIKMEDFSKNIRKDLKHKKDPENNQKGRFTNRFDDWEKLEEYLEVPIHNPLQNISWIEEMFPWIWVKGTEDGHLEELEAYSEGRVTDAELGNMNVHLRIIFQDQEVYTADEYWNLFATFESETLPMGNGNTALVVRTDHTSMEQDFLEVYFAQDHALYKIEFYGNEMAYVRKAVERLLAEI